MSSRPLSSTNGPITCRNSSSRQSLKKTVEKAETKRPRYVRILSVLNSAVSSGRANAATQDARYSDSQSKHELQLSRLKWGSQGDAMAITQPASQPAVFCSSPEPNMMSVLSALFKRGHLKSIGDANTPYAARTARPISDETHRKSQSMWDRTRLKFTSSKTLLSLTSIEESPGFSMYIHDWKSLFNNCADVYQPRRFLLLGASELRNFKQTAGSHTSCLTFNYTVPSVVISGQAALLRDDELLWCWLYGKDASHSTLSNDNAQHGFQCTYRNGHFV